MAKSRAAGNAKILLTLDDRIQAGLRRVQVRLSAMSKPLLSIGSRMAAVSGTISSALFGASIAFAKTGGELEDMAGRTGISANSLSELSYAAKQTSTDLGDIEKAARKMQKDGIDPNRFDEYADRIAAMEDPLEQARAAMEAFGTRTGPALLPMIRQLPELRKRARELAITMSNENAKAADDLGDAMDGSWAQVRKLVETIGSAIAGPLTRFLTWSQDIVASGIHWMENNKQIVRTVAMVAGGLAIGAALFIGTGLALAIGAAAAGGFATAIGYIGAVISAIASPIGVVVAAIGGLATWFAVGTETGRVLVSNLATWFGELAGIVKETFGAIVAALRGGDLQAAGKAAMAGLNLAWQKGTHGLETTWIGLKDAILGAMTNLVFDIEAMWTRLLAAIKTKIGAFLTETQHVWDFLKTFTTMPIKDWFDPKKRGMAAFGVLKRDADRRDADKAAAVGINTERDKALGDIDTNRRAAAQDRERRLTTSLAAAEKELTDALAESEAANKNARIAGVNGLSTGATADLDAAIMALSGISAGAFRPQQTAILDASLAAQQFGGRDESIVLLRDIRDDARKREKRDRVNGLPGD